MTVKLVDGIDSAKTQPGAIAHAIVTKSTNPGIPKNAQAIVQLGVDPSSGGLGIQLVQLIIGNQKQLTSSVGATLLKSFLGRFNDTVNGLNNKIANQQVSLTGGRVLLPPNTLVQFTLTGVSPQTSSLEPTRQVVAPDPPNSWQPTQIPYGSAQPGDSAVTLSVAAASGSKHGHAHLIVSCTNRTNLSVYLTISQALTGYGVDDYNAGTGMGETSLVRLMLGNDAELNLFVSGNSGDDSPVRLNFGGAKNGFPDSFFSAASAGKQTKLTLLAPDGKGLPTVISFTLPTASSPLVATASTCLTGQAQEEAERKARIVVSCPDRVGKVLVDAKVKATQAGHSLDYSSDGGEGFGGAWDLKSPQLKAGLHPILECIYGLPGSSPASEPKIVPTANRLFVALPVNAATCETGEMTPPAANPVYATCSRK